MPDSETDERPSHKVAITEGQVVRWLCYIGFFYCTIMLVTGLTANTAWLGYALGTVAFGTFALKMYVLYQAAERQAEERRARAAEQANRSGGRGRFVGLDEDDQ
jgi:hypothetical protein